MMFTLILILSSVLSLLVMTAFLVSRYKRCPADKLLVVFGRTKGGSAQVYHGGGVFIWPVIQDYKFLDLEPMTIPIDLKKALSKQNIRVDIPSAFTVAISTADAIRRNAAERLLSLNRLGIMDLASNIIFGQLRLVIATMDIEEINSNRDKFLVAITTNLETELEKIGLHLINSNIQDIHDESGYIGALGQEAAAGAINAAKVSVAEKTRDGDIGQAVANKERTIETSKLTAESQIGQANAATQAQIGQADAAATSRAKTAEYNAKAVEGENTAMIHVANTTAARQVAEAEATKKSTIARNVAIAKAQEETYVAEQKAEQGRALRDKSTQYADVVVPAEIAKNKMEVDAEAEAEALRRVAKGKADAVILEKQAEGAGIRAVFEGQAAGFEKLVKTAGSPEAAIQLLIIEQLPELMRIQVDAVKGIKIDNITVWDTGGKSGEGSSTTDFIQNFMKAIPAFSDVYKNVAGQDLPSFLNTTRSIETTVVEPLNENNK